MVQNRILGLLLLSNIMISGCYEPQDGCLDPLSENYDVAADRDCKDCCRYPKVRFGFKYLYNGSAFRFTDTITNNLQTQALLLNQNIYLAEIELIDNEGNNIALLDSITLNSAGIRIRQAADFLHIRRNISQSEISSVRFSGFLHKVSFRVGLPPLFNGISLQPSPHPALDARDNMRDTLGNFFAAKFIMAVGTNLADTIEVVVRQSEPIVLEPLLKPKSFFAQQLSILIRLDYNRLFENIDLKNDNELQIANQIQKNFVKAIIWDE